MEHSRDQRLSKHDSEHSSKKQEPLLELDARMRGIDNLVGNLDGVSLAPKQKARLERIKNKIIKSKKYLLRTVAQGAIAAAVFGVSLPAVSASYEAIGYELNPNALEQTVSENGEIVYSHPDERTTHYLNILAGKDRFTDEDLKFAGENERTVLDLNKLAGFEKFTEEDIESRTRGNWKETLERCFSADLLSSYPKLGEMSSLDLATLFFKLAEESGTTHYINLDIEREVAGIKEYFREVCDDRAEFRSSGENNLYDLVWNLERECGNPKIRFIGEDDISVRSGNSACYLPRQNTMYMAVDDLIGGTGVVAEMSHAKQWKKNPPIASLRRVSECYVTNLRTIFSRKGYWNEYDKLYGNPSSLEYQAHRVIQPDLEKRYPIAPSQKIEQAEDK